MKRFSLVLVILLAGCGNPMGYDEMKKDEQYCLDRGLKPIRLTNGFIAKPIKVSCQDGDGTYYDIPKG